jgi:hypothetical protein
LVRTPEDSNRNREEVFRIFQPSKKSALNAGPDHDVAFREFDQVERPNSVRFGIAKT